MKHALYLLLFILTLGVGTAAAGTRPVDIDDQYQIRTPKQPVFSPDGKWLAYAVDTPDYEKGEASSRIWMVPSAGGEPVAMSAAGDSSWSPEFSRDGSRLFFLSARHGGKTQLWSLDLRHGGEAAALTRAEHGIDAIRLSPDERRLLVVRRDPKAEAEALVEGSEPWVVDRLQFKADYRGYLDRRRDHVYIHDLDNGQETQITTGDYDDADPAWSPDSRWVAFSSNRTADPDANENSDIWVLELDGNKALGKPLRLNSGPGPDLEPLWHPDSRRLAYRSRADPEAGHYGTYHLAVIGLDDNEPLLLSRALDRNVSALKGSRDGKYLYFSLEDSGAVHIAALPWRGGKVSRPIQGQFSAGDYAVSGVGKVATVISHDNQPSELYITGRSGLKQLGDHNGDWLAQLNLGETREIHAKSHDGLEIEAFVTLPPDYREGERYPVILLIHGGPVGQYDHSFSFKAHWYAAQGYVVVRSNPRGSSGYGQDFCYALFQGWGEKDYRDVLVAVDRVVELGYGDADRTGLGGYSYGGILTNYIIGQTGRFKAAVSGAGSGLYTASYGHDEYQYWYESELGVPWGEYRELWERLSPFNHIHKATTPTLFMGGEKDWNVPIQGSEQLYQVMKRVGIDTQLVVYPDEFHGGWSYANDKDYLLRALAWYDRYLKDSYEQAVE